MFICAQNVQGVEPNSERSSDEYKNKICSRGGRSAGGLAELSRFIHSTLVGGSLRGIGLSIPGGLPWHVSAKAWPGVTERTEVARIGEERSGQLLLSSSSGESRAEAGPVPPSDIIHHTSKRQGFLRLEGNFWKMSQGSPT